MIFKNKKIFSVTMGILGFLFVVFIFTFWSTKTIPNNFPVGTNFVVEEGESLRSISNRLQNENYIKSALLFRAWISFLGRDRHIQLGVYSFDKPLVLGAVIKKLVSGNPDAPLVSITIPEGSTSFEVASIIKKELPKLSVDIFGEKVFAKKADGKLFPSTYYLLPSTTEERIVDIMTETFDKKYEASFSKTKINSPLKDKDDVIILASILEGEAKTSTDMKIVAGILLKRLSLNMALQVDVAKETYNRRGLPIQPINNPGMIALDAVLNPTTSPYLYYITGRDGIMHYSKTFEEHKRNIKKFL
ncbi:TPA: hypothetical protein DEP94_01000 [Candidatus Nomurabacteria bacterium]|nr:hypothetical protein [Candidatus Nomurabacteria bacterium]